MVCKFKAYWKTLNLNLSHFCCWSYHANQQASAHHVMLWLTKAWRCSTAQRGCYNLPSCKQDHGRSSCQAAATTIRSQQETMSGGGERCVLQGNVPLITYGEGHTRGWDTKTSTTLDRLCVFFWVISVKWPFILGCSSVVVLCAI